MIDDGGQHFGPCPFCDLNQIAVVYEWKAFRLIYNHRPITRGHTLVIPKRHVESLLGLDDAESSELFGVTRTAIRAINAHYSSTAFDFALQEGLIAGQSIPHLHFHIVPRGDGDLSGPGNWYPELVRSADEKQRRPRNSLHLDKMRAEAAAIRLTMQKLSP